MTLVWVNDRWEEEDPSVVHYFNVEKTENPYISIYEEVDIEELSDNFKMHSLSSHRLDGYLEPIDREYCKNNRERFYRLDIEGLEEALKSYKEQLLENKRKIIIDTNLLGYKDMRHISRNYMLDVGLSLGNDGKVSLKRIYKPKPKTVSQSEIKNYLQSSLNSHLYAAFGIKITIYEQTDRLYQLISLVKTLCPTLLVNEFITGINGNFKTECEKLWNNPELAKKQPKKAAKKENK